MGDAPRKQSHHHCLHGCFEYPQDLLAYPEVLSDDVADAALPCILVGFQPRLLRTYFPVAVW